MQQKIGVRFKIGPKIYSFVSDIPLERGDNVVVETALGQGFGKVEKVEPLDEQDETLKKVIRKATLNDQTTYEQNCEKEKEAISITKQLVEKFKLDMNVVNAEYSFDGSKVVIDFISEDRVDFRDLVKDLATKLKTRIELRQIGIRDQAKMVGGIGICGRVCCCAAHLKDFEKVSIKMAKVQGLALNPTKISGSCGRLMCCLEYENEYYNEVYPKVPKVNSEVKTPEGTGVVMFTDVLKQLVSVKLTSKDGTSVIKEFSLDSISKKFHEQNTNGKSQSSSSQSDKKHDGQKQQLVAKISLDSNEEDKKVKLDDTKKQKDKTAKNFSYNDKKNNDETNERKNNLHKKNRHRFNKDRKPKLNEQKNSQK